ncbi:MAG TPA: hypothetical protein PKA10_19765 [Selenomonadales bacterium]|nr:hypothetical protein [Selenomonadales bacterium]
MAIAEINSAYENRLITLAWRLTANQTTMADWQWPDALPLLGNYILVDLRSGTCRIVVQSELQDIPFAASRQVTRLADLKNLTLKPTRKNITVNSGTLRQVSEAVFIEFNPGTDRIVGFVAVVRNGTERKLGKYGECLANAVRHVLKTETVDADTQRRLSSELIAYFGSGTNRVVYQTNISETACTLRNVLSTTEFDTGSKRFIGRKITLMEATMRKVLAQPFNNEVHIPLRFSHILNIKMRMFRYRGE